MRPVSQDSRPVGPCTKGEDCPSPVSFLSPRAVSVAGHHIAPSVSVSYIVTLGQGYKKTLDKVFSENNLVLQSVLFL